MSKTTWEDLVTTDGQLIRLEIPTDHQDEIIEAINNAQRRGDDWSPQMIEGCKAEYMGMPLSRVNMQKVIGWL